MSDTHDTGAPEGVSEDTSAADQVAEDANLDTSGDDAAAATGEDGEDDGEQPSVQAKKPTAQERIAEVTRARREAEREAAHWKRIAQESARPQEEQRQAPQADAKPDPADYQWGETDPGFIAALSEYHADRRFELRMREQEQRAARNTVEQTWTERQASFAKEKPDYFEVLDRDWVCSPPMADAIRTSDDGAAVAYHLASNPAEARRIAALNPLAQIREIGRLEARLSKPTEQASTAKTVSDAPAPAPQIRGSGGKFKVAPDTNDFAAFEKTYGG